MSLCGCRVVAKESSLGRRGVAEVMFGRRPGVETGVVHGSSMGRARGRPGVVQESSGNRLGVIR